MKESEIDWVEKYRLRIEEASKQKCKWMNGHVNGNIDVHLNVNMDVHMEAHMHVHMDAHMHEHMER
jgi:hypothetical protein